MPAGDQPVEAPLPSAAGEPRAPSALGHSLAVAVAMLGGVLGIVGAVLQELRSGGFLLLPLIGAPIIEELLKPTGVYLLLARWPHLLRGRLHTALLTALAGLTFGLIEALVYVTVYVPDPPAWFVTYRFTLPIIAHMTASFIVGLGINRGLLDWAGKGWPLPKATRNFYLAGIGLHAVFNTTAITLTLAGVFGDV